MEHKTVNKGLCYSSINKVQRKECNYPEGEVKGA